MSPENTIDKARETYRSLCTLPGSVAPLPQPVTHRGTISLSSGLRSSSARKARSGGEIRMLKAKILLADSDHHTRELVRYVLTKEGYKVVCAVTGEEALAMVEEEDPDPVLLEVILGGVEGLDFCRYVKRRAATSQIPIIILSAHDDDADIIAGLDAGADDYLTKPFSIGVLLARIRAALRNRLGLLPNELSTIELREITIDPSRHRVVCRGRPVGLTATQFGVLYYLATRPGRVCTRDQIIQAVKGADYPVTERSVDVQIVALRKKLGKAGDRIETVWGVGYRFRK